MIRLQVPNGQRVDIDSRGVQQPPRERIEDRGLVFPGDLHGVRFAHDVAGQNHGVRATRFVVLRRRTQPHPLGRLAIRADRAQDEHADLPAVRQALVRLRDIDRRLVVGLYNQSRDYNDDDF